VTNTGESKNELTNLTVQKPLLGNYEILDVRTSKQAVDEVETLDQLNYNLKGLAKGGTFILRFSVKANDVGTYQFSATVNPNSALDQNTKNNTDTIILKANTKIDTTYVPSVDCPRITATELDSNTELEMLKPDSNGEIYNYTCNSDNWNIFAERENLKGLRIQLDGASTVIVYRGAGSGYQSSVVELSNGRLVYAGASEPGVRTSFNSVQKPSSGVEFRDGVIEITVNTAWAVILCRPAGKNCRWQAFGVVGASNAKQSKFTATDVVNAKIKYENFYNSSQSFGKLVSLNTIPPSVEYNIKKDRSIGHSLDRAATVISKMIVTVKSGTAASLTLGKTDNDVRTPYAQGKTTITENRVTVAADATSTDSINSPYLQVIVED